jgi:release factor H-coupled RctB family protein
MPDNVLQRLDDKTVLLASPATWIEGEAVRQLRATAALPGMIRCAGMPDLTPAKSSPTGAAFACDLVRPNLVGSDIGCGIGLWQTSLPRRKVKVERLVSKLDGLDQAWDGDPVAWLKRDGLEPTGFEASLGTVGQGNHFTEVQEITEILNQVEA